MRDYRGLTRRLEGEQASPATMTFEEIEGLIGTALPNSARKHQAWWANTETHSHAGAWMRPGWRTSGLDMAGEKITFVRSAEPNAPSFGVAEAPARWVGPDREAKAPAAYDASRVSTVGTMPKAAEHGVRSFPAGLTPMARRLLEVDCERRGVDWEEAIVTMLNTAAVDYWNRTWAELDAMTDGKMDAESSVDILRRLRDGEEDDD